MTDRQIGYFSLTFLLLFIVFSLSAVLYRVFSTNELRIVRFDTIGNLNIEDAIRVRGVSVGRICGIDWHEGRACVKVLFEKPVEIHSDYRIYSVDVGIMGERNLTLSCGSPSAPIVGPGDTLQGLFVIGPSEAIGMMHLLEKKMVQLAGISTALLYGKDNTPSLVSSINDMVRVLDSVSIELLDLCRIVDEAASAQMARLEGMVGKAAAFSGDVSRAAPAAFDTFEQSVASLSRAVDKLESGIEQLLPLLAYLEGPEMEQWKARLLALQKKMAQLHELLDDLARRGLNLKVRFFR